MLSSGIIKLDRGSSNYENFFLQSNSWDECRSLKKPQYIANCSKIKKTPPPSKESTFQTYPIKNRKLNPGKESFTVLLENVTIWNSKEETQESYSKSRIDGGTPVLLNFTAT